MIEIEKYDNFISLGYFCSIASEIERAGLRNKSFPFDWCITNFECVVRLIENKFENFLQYENLYQGQKCKEHYFDKKNRIWFFHDFDKYYSLKSQLPKVSRKYNRRINRFYKEIKNPTLFIRYISNEVVDDSGKSIELTYIEENDEYIKKLLKSFNEENEIIYIANSEIKSDTIKIFSVEKDENDTVARKPFEKNKELYNLFYHFNYANRDRNIKKYNKKNSTAKKTTRLKVFNKIYSLKYRILKVYVHNKCIDDYIK